MQSENADTIDEFQALQKVIQYFATTTSESFEDGLLQTILEIFQADSAAIASVEQNNILSLVSAVGSRWHHLPRNVCPLPPDAFDSKWFEALRKRTVVFYQHTGHDEVDSPFYSVAIPIFHQEYVSAILDLCRKRKNFNAQEYRIASVIGQLLGYIYHLRNLNNEEVVLRKQSQDSARVALKRARLYFSVLSHDIRNHLQTILHTTSLMKDYHVAKDILQLISVIDHSVWKSARMISRIELSEQLQHEPLTRRSLIAAIKESVNYLSRIYSDALVEIRYHTESAVVRANDLLDEMIWNLLQNAVQHNSNQVKRIWITIEQENDGYQVSISDNGPGIDEEVIDSLSDTELRRTGISLHQSYQIVETYGGKLEISERVPGSPEQGSLLRIWLPAGDSHAIT
ncbi:MAG: hypothetical protein GF411_13115 [Candidatus Lokiarchaeota archaeon]|nr:hypothetical protein [Candidatus Lokiarchaeota archaeon]